MGEIGGEFPTGDQTSSVVRLKVVTPEVPQIEQQRVQAIAEMREIAKGQEKESSQILPYLDEGHNPYDAKAHAVLILVKNPEAKAGLVRIIVNQCLREGDRAGAVGRLLDAGAAKLSLPEFDSAFIVGLYSEAFAESKFEDARLIANKMLHERDSIVKTPDSEKGENRSAWEKREQEDRLWGQREQEAFEKHAKFVLAKPILPDDEKGAKELWNLVGQLKNRPASGVRSELGISITKKLITLLEAQGRQLNDPEKLKIAKDYAASAGMPEEAKRLDLKAKKMSPGLWTRASNFLARSKSK